MMDWLTKFFKMSPESAQAKLEPAIKNGCVDEVRRLLARGVDPNKCGVYRDSPLYIACDEGNLDVIKLLLAAKADARSDTSPLFAAEAGYYKKEKVKIIRLLLAAGADVNAISGSHRNWTQGRTLLHAAASNREIVEFLLEAGANVNALDAQGRIPLHDAARHNATEAIKLFLEAGSDVNAPDKYGSTPLHVAATENQKEVVSLLLAMGADVNARDTYGSTPLHKASEKGRFLVIELLLAAGADVRIADKRGKKPIDLAIQEGHREEVRLLDPHADVSRIFKTFDEWLAARGPFYDHGRPIPLVDYLLALGETGRANLMAEYEKERQRFMATNAAVGATDKSGVTPVFTPALKCHEPTSSELVNLTGRTVIIKAVHLEAPLNRAPAKDRLFRCASRVPWDGGYYGRWLSDGSSGEIGDFMIEKVID